MGEHLALCVDRLIPPESFHSLKGSEDAESSGESSCSHKVGQSAYGTASKEDEEPEAGGEDEPLLQPVECRICQEEDSPKNLEIPCSCNGSLKYAHRKCVQRWCNEKGDIICEICHQPYQPGYTAPPPPSLSEDIAIDMSGGWTVAGTQLDLHDPRLLAMAAAERHLLEADYDEYADSSASGAAFCRSAALILMALILLRHAVNIGNGDGDDDDVSAFFSLFLLRAAVFLLPCYIMAWAIGIMQRRQRQEAAALAAAEVAFMLQAGQHRGLHVTIAPGPAQAAEPSANPTSHVATPTGQVGTPPPELVVMVLILCIGFLSIQPEKVSALRSIDLALRWGEGNLSFLRSSRILKANVVQDLHTQLNIAPAPSMSFDPNQSNKRRVRRGSDPIHNKC
ncbi:hypothetical protein HAX54_016293 [Datura stramonium]|uniref:RING-CH-type domain-containing protein n=1 Tax=Datura stramonium TaxID=4076 RepID=A0ABS8RZV4_DATST|nr:hypothetical protein [Datura stramonium]